MARMPRLVVPGYPHHVTQRGNRRMETFFCSEDYRAYMDLLAKAKAEMGVAVWAYCLMPNHVHLVVVPDQQDSLARLFRSVHRHYSRRVNFREQWRGHLWQERFHSFVMDERYLLATVRYTELNPLRARLCINPADWPWSSARAHFAGRDDAIVSVQPMLDRVADWGDYLAGGASQKEADMIRRCASTGRPAGDELFVERLEVLTGRELKRRKPGPKPSIK
ncbi:MAG: transposase [Halioglobus sp.]|jgi:putative transposase